MEIDPLANTKVKLPTRVKIGAHSYTITKEDLSDDGILGCTRKTQHEIKLHKGMPPTLEAETAIHELLHAGGWVWGIEWTSGEQEEHVVNSMANALASMFKDNPKLLDYLKDSLK